MINEFDSINGFLVEKGDKIFTSANRSFKYGDGIFETIKLAKGKMLLEKYHLQRIELGLKTLKFDTEKYDAEFFSKELNKVIQKNYYQNAKIRLFIFRESPGLYTPMGNRLGFFIEGVHLDSPYYPDSPETLNLGIYSEALKSADGIANCKTTSALIYVLAGVYKKENNWDDVVVLNHKQNVCEAVSSNIFAVIDGVLKTPALTEGPISGTVRNFIVDFCRIHNIKLEQCAVTLDELKNAQEMFLTNAVSGIQSVTHFNHQTIPSTEMAKKFQTVLKNEVKQFLE
jgi:branched-subunit amino acid aminotransferase/4-amino-4-deoxychorismate lyase